MARTQTTGENIRDNSVTGADVNESTLLDTLIPFSNAEFVAANIHDTIIEAKKSSVTPWKIKINEEIIIPKDTQMINYNGMEIRGQLNVRGMLVMR